MGGAAIQEYTPEGFVWVEAGDYGTIHGGTHILRERLDSKYGRYGLMWDTIEDSHLPRLDMNIDFLKRSLEIDDWDSDSTAFGSLQSLKFDVYIYRDASLMRSEKETMRSAIEEAVGTKHLLRVAPSCIGFYLSPLTTVLKSDGSAIWMWGAYSGDLSVDQVQEIRSDPSAGAFIVKAYHPFGKAAAYWRMIRNYIIQRRVFFYWMELPAKGSKRDVDKQEAIATFELLGKKRLREELD